MEVVIFIFSESFFKFNGFNFIRFRVFDSEVANFSRFFFLFLKYRVNNVSESADHENKYDEFKETAPSCNTVFCRKRSEHHT